MITWTSPTEFNRTTDWAKLSTNKIVTSNKEFLEGGPLGGAHPAMRPRKNEQMKEKRLSYAEAHKEEFERPKSQIRKVSRVNMTSRIDDGQMSPCPLIPETCRN